MVNHLIHMLVALPVARAFELRHGPHVVSRIVQAGRAKEKKRSRLIEYGSLLITLPNDYIEIINASIIILNSYPIYQNEGITPGRRYLMIRRVASYPRQG
ncbi:unnamed protein product, partial [Trichogramma brassicae]